MLRRQPSTLGAVPPDACDPPRPGPRPSRAHSRRRRWGGWLLIAAAVGNCAFLIAPAVGATLDPVHTFVSSLSSQGQPAAWLFRLSDVLVGAGLLLGVSVCWREVPHTAWLRVAQWSAVAFAIPTAADSLLPMDCDPGGDALCRAAEAAGTVSWQHQAHSVTGVLESVAMMTAILALALGTKRIPGWRGRSRTWFALLAVQLATSVSISVQYLGGLLGLGVSQRLAVLCWAASVALAGWSLVRGANQAWPQPSWPAPPPQSFRRLTVPIAGQPGAVVNAEAHHPQRPETVLVLSGLGLPLELWYPVVAAVPRACLVLVDRPGLGGSSAWHHPPAGLAEQFAVLDAVLEAAGRSGPVVLVGHSYGGLLAQAYAWLRPNDVSALVLVDASDPDQEAATWAPSAGVLRLVDRFTSTRWGAGLSGRAARWLIFSVGTARVDAARPPRQRLDAAAVRRQLVGTMAELGAIRSEAVELARAIDTQPELKVPARMLIGRWGGFPLYREQRRWTRRQFRRGEVMGAQPVVHRSAHLLMLDNPKAVADSINWAVAQTTGR